MKVAFINFKDGKTKNEYPQLGLLYLCAVARMEGYDVEYFDLGAINETADNIIKKVTDFKPEICGFSLYTSGLNDQYEFIKVIKSKMKGCHIIAGGPHASALPYRTMQECNEIDFLIVGEGENTIIELFGRIKGKMFSDVAGIYYRQGKEIFKTPSRQLIRDLDSLPIPAHDIVFNKKYKYQNRRMEIGRRVAPVIASRGCPWNCTFCYKGTFGTSYRKRSPQDVVREMLYLNNYHKINDIQFVDDLFAVNKKWLKDFCSELKKCDIKIHWKCLGRVDTLDKETLVMMKNSGCYGIEFGVESGDDDILKDINKKNTTQEVKHAFKLARRHGLITSAYFIYGNRLETRESILRTMNFAMEIKADFCGFAILLPFPGTKVYEMLDEIQKNKWNIFSGYYSYTSQISICSLKPKELQYYGKLSPTQYYGRISYLIYNILFSKHHILIKKNQLLFFGFHFLKRLYHIFRPLYCIRWRGNGEAT